MSKINHTPFYSLQFLKTSWFILYSWNPPGHLADLLTLWVSARSWLCPSQSLTHDTMKFKDFIRLWKLFPCLLLFSSCWALIASFLALLIVKGHPISNDSGITETQSDVSVILCQIAPWPDFAKWSKSVFLNCRALASIIPGRERPEETTICYKISLVQLITNLNVILYLSTGHTVYISVLILFMIMP